MGALCPCAWCGGGEDNRKDPATGLTVRQKTLITDSFAILKKDLEQHGINFFIALFATYPYMKEHFPQLTNVPEADLPTNQFMMDHAVIFMLQLQSFVDNLYDADGLLKQAQKVANKHLGRGIKHKQFTELQKMFKTYLKTELGDAATNDTLKAWNKLLGVICTIVKSAAKDFDWAEPVPALDQEDEASGRKGSIEINVEDVDFEDIVDEEGMDGDNFE